MFPDLARDDVFRLETARLWLRWPRGSDAAAIERFCGLWEVARYTARIPHPYPPGSAERFIYAAREANASGRDLTLVMTPRKGKRDAVGSISLETRGADRLTLGFVLAPEAWGKGLATEAAQAMVDTGFALDRLRSRSWPASGSRTPPRAACWKNAASRSPARGCKARRRAAGMVECHSFRLGRDAWARGRRAPPGRPPDWPRAS